MESATAAKWQRRDWSGAILQVQRRSRLREAQMARQLAASSVFTAVQPRCSDGSPAQACVNRISSSAGFSVRACRRGRRWRALIIFTQALFANSAGLRVSLALTHPSPGSAAATTTVSEPGTNTESLLEPPESTPDQPPPPPRKPPGPGGLTSAS